MAKYAMTKNFSSFSTQLTLLDEFQELLSQVDWEDPFGGNKREGVSGDRSIGGNFREIEADHRSQQLLGVPAEVQNAARKQRLAVQIQSDARGHVIGERGVRVVPLPAFQHVGLPT